MDEVKADKSRLFLSPSKEENFRYKLWPQYKANREGKPRPKWLPSAREYLLEHKGAEMAKGCEADDMLGVYQTYLATKDEDSIICSIDKDLLTIAGKHYNFVKKEFIDINKYAAQFNFWKQMLVGDTADNVVGVRGIGEKKATKALEQLEMDEWREYVRGQYDNDVRFCLNYNLLRIWTEPRQLFNGWRESNFGKDTFEVEVVRLGKKFKEDLSAAVSD